MNAAAKALAQTHWSNATPMSTVFTKRGILVFACVILVLLSALSVVYVKAVNRRLFSDLQVQQQHRDHLQVDWGRLLLEQSTWATQSRIQRKAQSEFDMVMPGQSHIIVVKERE